MVIACFYVETCWIGHLPGIRLLRTPTGTAARGALERILSDEEEPQTIISTEFRSLRAVLDPADCALPFDPDRPLIGSLLAHPLAALRFARLAYIAGRAIPVVVRAAEEGIG